MTADPTLVRRLHREVGDRLQSEQLRRRASGEALLQGAAERQFARKLITDVIAEDAETMLGRGERPLTPDVEAEIAEGIHARMYGAGQLQRLLDDESIEDININGCDVVWLSRAGGMKEPGTAVAANDEELVELVQTLAAYSGLASRPWDLANPELDLRLPDGSRLSAVMGVTERPSISIRRHRFAKLELGDLVGLGTMSAQVAEFFEAVVRGRFNTILSGAPGSGKTTTLRALASEIGPEERIVTIEKALELGLGSDVDRHPDCVELEERTPNSEGRGGVDMAQLVRRSLRMSPDRVIVGEVLGPEILTMLNAMSQGNDGSLSTIHARSAREVFQRIANYAIQANADLRHEATYSLVAGALDFVVFLRKDRQGVRRIDTVLEVNGFDGQVLASEIFAPDSDGTASWTGVMPSRTEHLVAVGWQPPGQGGTSW